jgi:hypothetical protein
MIVAIDPGSSTKVLLSTASGTAWTEISTAALQGLQGIQGTQGTQGIQGIHRVFKAHRAFKAHSRTRYITGNARYYW